MSVNKSTRHNKKKMLVPIFVFSVIPVWVGIVIAPYVKYGVGYFLSHEIDFFKFQYSKDTFATVGVLLLIYVLAAFCYYTSIRNKRPDEEYGGLHWGDPYEITKKYSDKKHILVTKEEAEQYSLNIIKTVEIKYFTKKDLIFLGLSFFVSLILALLFSYSFNENGLVGLISNPILDLTYYSTDLIGTTVFLFFVFMSVFALVYGLKCLFMHHKIKKIVKDYETRKESIK